MSNDKHTEAWLLVFAAVLTSPCWFSAAFGLFAFGPPIIRIMAATTFSAAFIFGIVRLVNRRRRKQPPPDAP